MLQTVRAIFEAGGWVMYPLLALSFLSVTLSIERTLFWLRTHSGRTRKSVRRMRERLASGDLSGARGLADGDRTVYGLFVSVALDAAGSREPAEHDLHEAVEEVRPAIERFGATLSAVITAAPMLGILGTVTGIIASFRLLGGEGPITDPAQVAGGIAQALYTTAFGLAIALLTLFPYVIFRAQSERSLARMESLGAAMLAGVEGREKRANPAPAS